jgi:hypothetical protein
MGNEDAQRKLDELTGVADLSAPRSGMFTRLKQLIADDESLAALDNAPFPHEAPANQPSPAEDKDPFDLIYEMFKDYQPSPD